jgi:transcriptional regulator of acetoin/glycerol metabolism
MNAATIAEAYANAATAADELKAKLIAKIAADPAVNIVEVSRISGIPRSTIYRELAIRQQRFDELSANGTPAQAPADHDR